MSTQAVLFEQLREYAREIGAEKKAAATKRAEPKSEPGGYMGASTHPSADIDDAVQDSEEGARSSENTSDVKALPQGPVTVDATSEGATDGKQDERQINIGTNQSATGEDPSAEDNYKGDKDDPGTSHPATTEDGEKYGSWAFSKLAAHCGELANEILADISTGKLSKDAAPKPASKPAAKPTQKPVPTPAAAPAAAPPAKTAADVKAAEDAAKAGYELAAMAGLENVSREDRGAQFIANTIKEASAAADETASYLQAYWQTLQKKAEGDEETESSTGEDHNKPGDSSSGSGEGGGGGGENAPPAAAGDPMAGGGGGGEMPPEVMAALAGAGGGGGGAPPEAGLGQVGSEEAVMQLAQALMEMGISPEELVAAVQQAGAGGGGGGPPGGDPMAGGGMPPGMPPGGGDPMAGGGMPPPGAEPKLASVVKNAAAAVTKIRRSGKFAFGPAKSARESAIRGHMRNFVAEVLNA